MKVSLSFCSTCISKRRTTKKVCIFAETDGWTHLHAILTVSLRTIRAGREKGGMGMPSAGETGIGAASFLLRCMSLASEERISSSLGKGDGSTCLLYLSLQRLRLSIACWARLSLVSPRFSAYPLYHSNLHIFRSSSVSSCCYAEATYSHRKRETHEDCQYSHSEINVCLLRSNTPVNHSS